MRLYATYPRKEAPPLSILSVTATAKLVQVYRSLRQESPFLPATGIIKNHHSANKRGTIATYATTLRLAQSYAYSRCRPALNSLYLPAYQASKLTAFQLFS